MLLLSWPSTLQLAILGPGSTYVTFPETQSLLHSVMRVEIILTCHACLATLPTALGRCSQQSVKSSHHVTFYRGGA